jgi:hypothetical protein
MTNGTYNRKYYFLLILYSYLMFFISAVTILCDFFYLYKVKNNQMYFSVNFDSLSRYIYFDRKFGKIFIFSKLIQKFFPI